MVSESNLRNNENINTNNSQLSADYNEENQNMKCYKRIISANFYNNNSGVENNTLISFEANKSSADKTQEESSDNKVNKVSEEEILACKTPSKEIKYYNLEVNEGQKKINTRDEEKARKHLLQLFQQAK